MSSDFTKVFYTCDVWEILDTLCSRSDIRREGRGAIAELIECGYARALDDVSEALSDIVKFTVSKKALSREE